MIALVDYGMGNLRSVEKALARVGADVRIVSEPAAVQKAEALVLPGVGAFGDCLANLRKLKLEETIREFVASGKPFLGICLGFQALFESSEEAPGVKGLGLFPGSVPRFNFNGRESGSGLSAATGRGTKPPPTLQNLKVPHMGWNQLRVRRKDCPLLVGIEENPYVYFVHSYYCRATDQDVVCGTTDYGGEFCSMLWRGNVFATQFHPEKSQAIGLQMLQNFVGLVKK